MPTKKIRDLEPNETCVHREHNPPMHMVYAPGVWEHTCPGCGYVQTFTVCGPTWNGVQLNGPGARFDESTGFGSRIRTAWRNDLRFRSATRRT